MRLTVSEVKQILNDTNNNHSSVVAKTATIDNEIVKAYSIGVAETSVTIGSSNKDTTFSRAVFDSTKDKVQQHIPRIDYGELEEVKGKEVEEDDSSVEMGPPARKKFAVEAPSSSSSFPMASTINISNNYNNNNITQVVSPLLFQQNNNGGVGFVAVPSTEATSTPTTTSMTTGNDGLNSSNNWNTFGTNGPCSSNNTSSTQTEQQQQQQPIAFNASDEIRRGAIQMANELNEFIYQLSHQQQQGAGAGAGSGSDSGPMLITDMYSLTDHQIMDLQLGTCRKLRELLLMTTPTAVPTTVSGNLSNRDKLLQVAQMYNWIPLLLSWLNLHDRAAVQVEALLALTNIAELCAAQQQYQQQQQQQQLIYNNNNINNNNTMLMNHNQQNQLMPNGETCGVGFNSSSNNQNYSYGGPSNGGGAGSTSVVALPLAAEQLQIQQILAKQQLQRQIGQYPISKTNPTYPLAVANAAVAAAMSTSTAVAAAGAEAAAVAQAASIAVASGYCSEASTNEIAKNLSSLQEAMENANKYTAAAAGVAAAAAAMAATHAAQQAGSTNSNNNYSGTPSTAKYPPSGTGSYPSLLSNNNNNINNNKTNFSKGIPNIGLLPNLPVGTAMAAPGSVPFPPLSFSQTLSPEAVAAFDASLANTINAQQQQQQQQHQQQQMPQNNVGGMPSTSMDSQLQTGTNINNSNNVVSSVFPTPQFPSAFNGSLSSTNSSTSNMNCTSNAMIPTNISNTATGTGTGGINFSSLAPPPGGAHSSVPMNVFMPPPTPVLSNHPSLSSSGGGGGSIGYSTTAGSTIGGSIGGSTFPQQLSASSQHLLLRHADAIPTLISLLSSPSREVYEQAMWILGSIAAGDSPSGGANSALGNGSNGNNNNLGGNNDRNNMNVNAPELNQSNSTGHSNNNSGNPSNNSNNIKSVSARDVILAAGVMNQLLQCLEAHPHNLSLQRIGSWTLSNLVDGIFQTSGPGGALSQQQSTSLIQSQQQQLLSHQQQLLQSQSQFLKATGKGGGTNNMNNDFLYSNPNDVVSGLNFAGIGGMGGMNGMTGGGSSSGKTGVKSINNNSSNNTSNNNNNTNSNTNNLVGPMSMGPGSGLEYSSASEIDMNMLLPVLRRLLHMTDSEVLSYVCWTLSHLCDGPSSHIAAVVTATKSTEPRGGLVPRLVELLVHPSWRVTKPALRTIGNIVCAECSEDTGGGGSSGGSGPGTCGSPHATDYTEVILECGAVPRLKELITHTNREIQKEACWTLSNIAAGTVDQIQAVIDSGAIPPLVNLVRDSRTDQEVRSEACWVVLNATSCGSDAQIEVLVDEGCVSVLGVLLSEASMVMMALEGLERVLQVEQNREMIRREQIENGEIEDDEETRTPILVSAALIEKARDQSNYTYSHHGHGPGCGPGMGVGGGGFGNSHANGGATCSNVSKKADRIWKQHFVSCALCKQSFSKHRQSDAMYCEECKCYVCCNCNCKIYHLDYQEELWALTEYESEAKKNAKKTKNKKKKAKLKEKKQQKQMNTTTTTSTAVSLTLPSITELSMDDKDPEDINATGTNDGKQPSNKYNKDARSTNTDNSSNSKKNDACCTDFRSQSPPYGIGVDDDEEGNGDGLVFHDSPGNNGGIVGGSGSGGSNGGSGGNNDSQQIDFVLYLQQTGSIIALSKLMDALDYGGDDYDDELDEYERKMIREQKQLLLDHHQHQQ